MSAQCHFLAGECLSEPVVYQPRSAVVGEVACPLQVLDFLRPASLLVLLHVGQLQLILWALLVVGAEPAL